MKRIQKRVWSLMLSVMILFMMMPIKTYAASYATSYIDQNGAAQQVKCERIRYSGGLPSGWYTINKDVTVTYLTVSGDVNLILADGYTLTVTGYEEYAGITVLEGNSLTIYGQTGGTGKLIATGGRYGAGIGADRYSEAAAGKVVIRGGTVQATGGNYGAGIGGTGGMKKNGPGGTVIISGGTVIAKSKYGGAGIGGGGGLNGVGGTVSITGGAVYATGGGEDGAGIGGAGIGGGYTYNGGTVTISGGIVNATGADGGAGIGGGSDSSFSSEGGGGGITTISGGKVTAIATDGGKGIGSGCNGSGEGTNIFTAGKIDATGGFGSAPTDGTNPVYQTTVTLPAGNNNKSVAYKVDAGEFIAATTDEEGKIYLWLSEGQKDIVIADYNKPQEPIFYYWSGTIATGDNNVSVVVKYAPTAKLVVPKQSMMPGGSSSFSASDIAEDVDSTELTITKIVQQPNSAYATASLNAGTVTVVSNAIGTTDMVVIVSDGSNTVEVTVPIEVVDMPTVAISITQSPIKTIVNAISFGLFYKNDIDVSIQATGDMVDHSEYQIVANADTFNENSTWISGNSFSISPTFKGRIYTRAVCTGGIKTDIAVKALVVDNVKPTITASYDASSASIAVSVIDDGAGIDTITYKVASGETQTIVLEPSETSDIATQYNFTIEHLIEGQYDVVINGTDNSNNVADSKTISINRTPAVVDATISPTTRSYDLTATSDVQTNITWNSASTVTQVVYDADSTVLTEGTHFAVTGSALTINSSYLQTLKPLVGNSAKFKIYFNAGNPAAFTVDFVDNHTKSDNAKLRDLTINGNTVAGFAADTTNYEVELAYGTVLATVGAQADDAHASVDINQVNSLPGTATIQVTAEDSVTTKKYTIHFTLANQTPISHNITIENGGNGTASANVSTAVKGTAITLSATPNSGYEFVQWQVISPVGLNITNNTFVMPDEAVTVKAIFGVKSPEGKKSDNAKLRDLTINGNTVAGFAADTTNYEVELPYGTVLATVGAQTDDAHAFVDITQVDSLPGTATIQVTAEDSVTTKKYTIHFTLANQTPISHNITIENGGNGTASANVATAVKGTAITLSATPNSGYEFVQWQVISPVGLNITNNTFVMPDEAVTVKAIFGVKSSDNTDNSGGGNSGGGNSSGGNSDVSSSSRYTTVTIQSEEWPGQPITAVVSVTATADSSATIPDQVVIDAIAKAQAEAKARNKTANDISVVLNITAPQQKNVLGVIISQTALKALVDAGVSSLKINGLPIRVSFDQKALRAVQSQSSGNVSITAVTRQELSDRAKTMIGTRPVYNITIGYTKNGSASTVTDLGEGIATVFIPYTLAQGEAAGYLYGVYVDGNDNASRIDGSAYDVNTGCLVFNVKHFSIYGVGYNKPSAKFTDISSHWAEKSIDYVVGRGLLAGTTDTSFSPDAAMTRGMLVTALGRLIGVDSKLYTTNSFTDVKVDSTFSPYIEWAYQKGIIQGIGDNQFAPDRAITREEIAVILQNYAKATGYTLPATHEVVTFVDASSISNSYSTAVKAMQQAGIMTGDSGNQFNPKTSATRAEVSSMLHRYINNTINPDTAQGWVLNDAGQYLYYKDGKILTGRQNIDGVKYSFNTAGILQVGWVKDDFGNWYFYSGNTMITGKWSQIDGNWYYFNNDGSIAISTKINDYEVDENGVRKIK